MNGGFAFLALCIAAAGYVVSIHSLRIKYHIARQSGHRLYLTVITLGVMCCFVAAPILALLAGLASLMGISLPEGIFTFFLGFVTFGVSIGGAEWDNRRDTTDGWAALWKAWEEDDLDLVCATAQSSFKPIAVTLDTGKVYVGLVADSLEPTNEKTYLSILPLYSGHRDKDTQDFKLTRRYQSLIDGLLSDDSAEFAEMSLEYVIVMPRQRIVTAHIFNPPLHKEVSGTDLADVGKATNEVGA